MKRIILVLAALLAAGSLSTLPAHAFTNECLPASACSTLPGDCGGTAVARASGGATAQAGACGASGNQAYATAGEGTANASDGVFSTSIPVGASVVAYGNGASAEANISPSAEMTGTASLSHGGIVSEQIVEGRDTITVHVYASSQFGAGSVSFDVTQAGIVSQTCSGAVHQDIVFYGHETSC